MNPAFAFMQRSSARSRLKKIASWVETLEEGPRKEGTYGLLGFFISNLSGGEVGGLFSKYFKIYNAGSMLLSQDAKGWQPCLPFLTLQRIL